MARKAFFPTFSWVGDACRSTARQNRARRSYVCKELTVRYLERNLDEAVTPDTKQINNEDEAMDKARIKGSAEQAKGAVKRDRRKDFRR